MANPLYREGTWSPTLTFSAGSSGVSYASTPHGVYTRIGRIVVAHFVVNLASKGTGSGAAIVSGLPFEDGVGVMHITMDQWARFAAALIFLGGGITPINTRGFALRAMKAPATSIGDVRYADLADNSNFNGTVVYTAKASRSKTIKVR
jgi:hypothetical protein